MRRFGEEQDEGVGSKAKNACCKTLAHRRRARRLESDLPYLDKLLGEKVESILGSGVDVIEALRQVRALFPPRALRVQFDASRSLRAVVRDVIAQAEERQKTTPGMYYAGAVLQHLVGAKLDCALGKGYFEHNSFSTADSPGARAGDFFLGDVAIHVTTSPGEAVIARCGDNVNDGHRPILVTVQKGLSVAEGLANNVALADRIDIFEVEQFIALNLYELGRFAADGRKTAVTDLVARYNEIVEEFETDPSLKIELRR